jgi:branched-chain amino acid transport system permease protein
VDAIFNLQQVLNGLQLGAIYALLALGYTMVYGVVRLINFAHGDFYMLGAYAAYGAFFLQGGRTGAPPFLGVLLAAMAAGAAAAMASNRLAYRPLRYRPRLSPLVAAIGVSMFLEYTASALPFLGPSPRPFPEVLRLPAIRLGALQVSSHALLDLVLAAVLMGGLTWLVRGTRLGAAMRAVAQDKDAARLMGIDVERVIPLTFLAGGAFAGAAGLLAATAYPRIQPFMGILPGLKAFVAAVLGGIGSIPGAVLGAFLMGLGETFATAWNSAFGEGIAFLVLILVLLVRPAGILGERTGEKL